MTIVIIAGGILVTTTIVGLYCSLIVASREDEQMEKHYKVQIRKTGESDKDNAGK